MLGGARRLLVRALHCIVRRAALTLALVVMTSQGVWADRIVSAQFGAATPRYAHGILGDAIEWGKLEIVVDRNRKDGLRMLLVDRKTTFDVWLPLDHVFEDVAPRLWDVTGDGDPEVVVVESDVTKGAALAIYNERGKLAETPHIGQRNRWLAPIGAADLDGDGHIEIAYVDRPHLAKTIRIWRYRSGALEPVADLPGFTNHRIGERDIAGGIRTCAGVPELIVATADWARVVAVRFDGVQFHTRDLGPHRGRSSFAKALAC